MAVHDEIDLEGEGPAGREPRPVRERRRTPGPGPWVAAALALVVGGSLAAPPGGVGLRTAPVVELGLLDLDLSGPPTQAWSLGMGDDGGYLPRVLAVIEGTVVVEDRDELIGHAVATGEPVWRVDLPAGSCQTYEVLTCVVRSGSALALVRRVDPADGVTSDTPVPGALLALDLSGDLLVITAGDGADHVVSRIRPDGSAVWERAVDLGLVAGDLASTYAVQLLGDAAYVAALEPVFLDLGTGADVPREAVSIPLDEGLSARTSGEEAGSLLYDVVRDGEVLLEDEPIVLAVDDALGGPVRLASGPEPPYPLVATARRGGDPLWTWDAGSASPVARVDGTVVLSAFTQELEHLQGLDELTGEERWRAEDRTLLGASASTLLVGSTSGPAVEALDPVTGAVLWTVDLPEPARYATEIPGGLLVRTADPGGARAELVMLAWRA